VWRATYFRNGQRDWTTIQAVSQTFGVPTSPHVQNWIFLENAFRPGDSGCLLVEEETGRACGLYLGDYPTGFKSKQVLGRAQNLTQVASF
jgi:hypothetical protein